MRLSGFGREPHFSFLPEKSPQAYARGYNPVP